MKNIRNTLYIFLPLIIIVNAICYIFFVYDLSVFKRKTIKIALAGDMKFENSTDIENAILMYLDNVNREGGIQGKKLELLKFDDQDKIFNAKENALKIANKDKALIVLGHYSSTCSTAAGEIYKLSEIPAITASATAPSVTSENEWYFSVVPNNDVQAEFIANYIYRTLNQQSVSIIYDKEVYGLTLCESFEKAVRNLGLEIKRKWSINTLKQNLNDKLKQIADELLSTDIPGVIFFACNTNEVAGIIKALKDSGKKFLAIGSDTFSEKSFINKLNSYPREISSPGYYSNFILCATPTVATEDAYRFEYDFYNKFKKRPSWYAIYYYDAVHVAVEAIKKANIKGKGHIREDRKKIRNALLDFCDHNTSVKGITGDIFFNKTRSIIKPYIISSYINQKLVPLPVQYYPIYYSQDKNNGTMFQKIINGDYITINNILMSKVNLVNTNLEIQNIDKLDMFGSKCRADFKICFTYSKDLKDFDVKFLNSLGSVDLETEIIENNEQKTIKRICHGKGEFPIESNFLLYPFDSHILKIIFKHPVLSKDKLIFVPDFPDISEKIKGQDNFLKITQDRFKIKEIISYEDSDKIIHNSSYLNQINDIKFSKFNVKIHFQRQTVYYFFKIIFPLIIILGILCLIFIIPMERYIIRLLILLTSVVISFLYQAHILSFITMEHFSLIELFIFIIYLFIIFNFFICIKNMRQKPQVIGR